MAGCFKRLGCLVLFVALALLAAGAWLTRGRWMPRDATSGGGTTTTTGVTAAGVVWEPLSPEGAERARAAVQSLNRKQGQAYASMRPGDIASYVFTGLQKQLPPSARDVRAAAVDDRLYVKALVDVADFGGTQVLGPLAGFLPERDTVTFGGDFEVVRPGLAQFRVREIRIQELSIPSRLIPKLLARVRRGAPPQGVADNGLPLAIPEYIGDVRVGRGQVTLYKNVQ